MSVAAQSLTLRRDARLISLVGLAHAFSHFYQLALPPLFPIMHAEVGLSFTELGLLVSVLYAVSGICQAAVGFVVDRVGPRPVLYAGVATMALATMLMGLAPHYPAMLVLAVGIGLGNSVLHPCDYTILSHNVSEGRVGRGFSIHALGGYVGYALAPITMIVLAQALGWRAALGTAGAAGIVFLAGLYAFGHGRLQVERARREDDAGRPRTLAGAMSPLARPVVIACFLFFCATATAQIGMQTFAPSALITLHGTALTVSNAAVTALLVATGLGILAGGVLADRSHRHHLVAVVCLIAPTTLAVIPGLVELPPAGLWSIYALMGFGFGLLIPSRDMLVRAAAPRRASGRVFGFVYSGLDVGAAFTPALFGWLVDGGLALWVFVCVSACYAAAMMTVPFAATRERRAKPA